MEGTGNQARCSSILLLFTLMSIPGMSIQLLEKDKCPPGEFKTEEGICCNKCPPGFKLLEKCQSANHRSDCKLCPEGQFSDQLNYSPTCRSCKMCKESRNEYQVSACKNHQNTICRCKPGYYKFSIDDETYECRKCKKCGEHEVETQSCTYEKNTECTCKENYYKVKNKCEPCSHCTSDCGPRCAVSSQTKAPDLQHPAFINVIAGCVVVGFVLLVLGSFITYMATKRFVKRKIQRQSSNPSCASKEQSKDFLVNFTVDSEERSLEAAVETPLCEQEPCKLPDCVPMIPDLIYTVLDLVPVHQVKQLVRLLGVTDMEIEQAELDHKYCREAHYQMLRVWAQRGSQAVRAGPGETVHQPLLEELIDKLRQIHLSRAAEELETKYAIQ